MTKLPWRLDGESPEQSAIRKVRSSCLGVLLWQSELCRPRWSRHPPRVDRCHLRSLDPSNHHAVRNHVWQAW